MKVPVSWLEEYVGYDTAIMQTILEKVTKAQVHAIQRLWCPVCGKEFSREAGGRNGVYCGTACKQKAYRQRRNAWRKQVGPNVPG